MQQTKVINSTQLADKIIKEIEPILLYQKIVNNELVQIYFRPANIDQLCVMIGEENVMQSNDLERVTNRYNSYK